MDERYPEDGKIEFSTVKQIETICPSCWKFCIDGIMAISEIVQNMEVK